MKKLVMAFIIILLLGAGLIVIKSTGHLPHTAPITTVIIVLIFGIGVAWLITKFATAKKSEKLEDELSKRILERTSSLSFYVSLYMWLAISMLSDKFSFLTEQTIGCGLIGMAVIFFVIWLYYKVNGFKDE